MDLKAKIARSLLISELTKERQIYLDAVDGGSKFSAYYTKKADAISEKIESI